MDHDSPMPSSDLLIPVESGVDVLPVYRSTPIETLLLNHNLGRRQQSPPAPQLVIATCMDFRIEFRLPPRFAFVLRTAGATVEPVLCNIAFGLSQTDTRIVAVIGHSDCAMVDVHRRRDKLMETMTQISGIDEQIRMEMLDRGISTFGFHDAVQHTLTQCESIRLTFDRVLVAPLFFDSETGALAQISSPRLRS